MASYTSVSRNFKDMKAAAEDLFRDLPATLPPNALGILHCDSQISCEVLLGHITDISDFPIVGGTTFTDPMASSVDEISASLTVIVKEGLEYSISISEPLENSSSEVQMQSLYNKCLSGLKDEVKLLMLLMPMNSGLTTDLFVNGIFHEAGSIPVFGGVTTNDLDSTTAYAFYNKNVYRDRMILIALGGDIRPVFAVGSQLTELTEYGPTVTESDKNIVYRVDNMTFCDYLRQIGIEPEQRQSGVDAMMQYGPLPSRLSHKLADDDGIKELRCISYTNIEEGSGAFSSDMPVGTKIHMGLIQNDDVRESTIRCLDHLANQMNAQKDYEYSTLLSVNCVARYFAMVGSENIDSAILKERVPSHFGIGTFYGFCEIGPTQGKNGEIHNRSHSASVVMCAI